MSPSAPPERHCQATFSWPLRNASGDGLDHGSAPRRNDLGPMNKAGIRDKDILLVTKQNDVNNGDRVVALINDEATVKHYERTSEAVILRPKSSEKQHKPIVITANCEIHGVVVAVLPSNLY